MPLSIRNSGSVTLTGSQLPWLATNPRTTTEFDAALPVFDLLGPFSGGPVYGLALVKDGVCYAPYQRGGQSEIDFPKTLPVMWPGPLEWTGLDDAEISSGVPREFRRAGAG